MKQTIPKTEEMLKIKAFLNLKNRTNKEKFMTNAKNLKDCCIEIGVDYLWQ